MVDEILAACTCGPDDGAEVAGDAGADAGTAADAAVQHAPSKTVSDVSMSVNFAGIQMKNPVNTAAGTFAFGQQFEKFFDVSTLGAITTKGASITPWPGNPAPRMCEVTSGIINSVGLQNPGVEGLMSAAGEYLRGLRAKDCQVICQVAGHSPEEFEQALLKFEEKADFASGFEINISCPNIACDGKATGSSPQATESLIKRLRGLTKRPLLVKMGPVNIPEIARACEAAGADGLSLINSIPGMAIDTNTYKSKISRPTGGFSGPAIHPIALRMVWEAHKAVSLPLCGIGGITSGLDAAEFLLAGATCVSVGLSNLYDPTSASRILSELCAWAQKQGVRDINELIGACKC